MMRMSWNGRGQQFFFIGFVCCLIAVLFFLVAFVSPYWVQSWPKTNSDFVRIGLWEACFDGYSHPSDYEHTQFFGCFWMFSKDLWNVRQWLLPGWFVAVLVMLVITLILIMVSAAVQTFLFITNRRRKAAPDYMLPMIAAGCMLFSSFFMIVSAIVYGAGRNDWDWMPRPDYNFLSWSYGFMIVSLFFSMFSGIANLAYANDLYRRQNDYKNPPFMGAGYMGPDGARWTETQT